MSNIVLNFDLSTTNFPELHKNKILLAESLLNYFNTRLNLNLTLEYKGNFEFKHIKYSQDDYKCAAFIENSTCWSVQDRSVDSKWLESFISMKKDEADNIKSPFYVAMSLNNLQQSNIDFFNYKKNKFKALCKDFDCFSFLPIEKQNLLKLNLNNFCNELDDVI